MRKRFHVGSHVTMSEDALGNYGKQYKGKMFTVESVATKYMPAKEFFASGKPIGYHPWFDDTGNALYNLIGFDSSLYDWELNPYSSKKR